MKIKLYLDHTYKIKLSFSPKELTCFTILIDPFLCHVSIFCFTRKDIKYRRQDALKVLISNLFSTVKLMVEFPSAPSGVTKAFFQPFSHMQLYYPRSLNVMCKISVVHLISKKKKENKHLVSF